MFYPSGPRHVYLEEKQGKQATVRRALNWDGTIIPNLLATDTGRFFIKYEERGPGVAVEFFPTAGNRIVSIHCKKIRCVAIIYRTFVRDEPSLPLIQYQFRAKDGNVLNFSVDNLVITALANNLTRKPRNGYQKK